MNNDIRPHNSPGTTTPKSGHPKKSVVGALLLAFIIALTILAFIIPASMSDGTEKYTGNEREVARDALLEFGYPNAGIDMISHLGELKYKVESVKRVNQEDVGCSHNSGSYRRAGYLVVISRHTFFGIKDQIIVVTPCGHKVGTSFQELYPHIDTDH